LQLRNTSASITDIAFGAGFSSSQHFATAFRKQYGCTPKAFRARNPIVTEGAAFHPIAG
jgi:AraC-like DNA-binding protein